MPSIAIPLSLRGQLLSGSRSNPSVLFSSNEPGAWYDPSDLSTMFQDTAGTIPVTASGQSVARINDKSGRGNHATQTTASARPTYQVDATGRGFLLFDGVDDWLVTPTITPGTDKVQVFAGVRKLSDVTTTGALVELSSDPTNLAGIFVFRVPTSAVNGQTVGFFSRGTATVGASSSPYPAPTTFIATGLGDISGDVVTLRTNGSQVAQTTTDQGTGNYLAYPMYIGRRAGTSLPYSGRIYSLIVRFGSNLTTDQIIQTEVWVNGKTGAY